MTLLVTTAAQGGGGEGDIEGGEIEESGLVGM